MRIAFGQILFSLACLLVPGLSAQATTRESVSSSGLQTLFPCQAPTISADGRYLAFDSDADNLVAGDTNGRSDVFVRDRLTGQTARVSVDSTGAQANHHSHFPDISADGRFVVFDSDASNLVPGDTNARTDVFCRDLLTGQTTRISVGAGGQQATARCGGGSVSGNGRFVVFESDDDTLVPGDTNLATDIFLRDRQTGATIRIGVSGAPGQSWARLGPHVSDDGLFVTFRSMADNLVPGDTNGLWDAFVYARLAGNVTRVSVSSAGGEGDGNSYPSDISADGRHVCFDGNATNLVAGDTNSGNDVFVHDRLSGTTTRVSVTSSGVQANNFSLSFGATLSGSGRFVTFWSNASNLVVGDTNSAFDCFLHDRQFGLTSRISVANAGQQGNAQSSVPVIAANGRCIAFLSGATNLVLPDTNGGVVDVYVRILPAAAVATTYGAGCPGTAQLVPAIVAIGLPQLGNAGFALGVSNGPSSSAAVLAWSDHSANVPVSGCDVLLGGSFVTQPLIALDALGAGATPFALPNAPALDGLTIYFQYLVLDPNGPFLGFSTLSNGLAAQLGY
jgi:hypothetical protein